ncbi:hypothetical protein Vafri_5055 [Volvox africanus]|uniref:JmjC domain-containing protein n=1 Tax=Volvox africanus TaxID=51714 RepID=A0A8J4AWF5_9CHLO|nr:hypothetical protein Vafri_5055 [Volvox africanus]
MTDSDLKSVPAHAAQHFTLPTCGGDVELNLSPLLGWQQDEEIIMFLKELSTAASGAVAVDAFRLLLEDTELHLRSLLSEPETDCVEAPDATPWVGVPLAAAAAAATAAAAVGDVSAGATGADAAMVPGQKTLAPYNCTVRGDPEGGLDLDPNTTASEYGYGINTGGDKGGVVGGHGNGNGCNPYRVTGALGSSSFSSSSFSSSSAAALLELCWEKLHLGYWKDVPVQDDLDPDPNADSRSAGDPERRGEATATAITTATATATATVPPMDATRRPLRPRQQWGRQWRRQRPCSRQLPLALLQRCLRQLDLGLMMGGPLWRRQMHRLVEDLHAAAVEAAASGTMQKQVASASASKVDQQANTSGGDMASRSGSDGGPGSGEGGGGSCSVGRDRSTKRLRGALEQESQAPAGKVARDAADNDVLDPVAEGLGKSKMKQLTLRAEHGSRSGGGNTATIAITTTATTTATNSNMSDVSNDVRLPRGSLGGSPGRRVPTVERPGLEDFLTSYMVPEQPVVITGAMEHWPAMTRWGDLSYLEHAAGCRTVPVEVGQHYLADGWGQQLMTLRDFLHRYLLPGLQTPPQPQHAQQAQPRGYLAQHPLFEQVPSLRRDIVQPDYCCLGQEGAVRAVNAWLGPAGTTTPLHTDPHHNLLAQVVGRKYVRLYASSLTDRLYPFPEGTVNSNSSQVDLDEDLDEDLVPDSDFNSTARFTDQGAGTAADVAGGCVCRRRGGRFPGVAELPYLDVILEPGHMLYIPPGWWHFVRAMSTSFSVSFWWS